PPPPLRRTSGVGTPLAISRLWKRCRPSSGSSSKWRTSRGWKTSAPSSRSSSVEGSRRELRGPTARWQGRCPSRAEHAGRRALLRPALGGGFVGGRVPAAERRRAGRVHLHRGGELLL